MNPSLPSKENGGAAFPCHGVNGMVFEYGMTLRDYLAAAALQGLVSGYPTMSVEKRHADTFAKASYDLADAMLKQREAQP